MNAWQTQSNQLETINMETIKKESQSFKRKIRLRNLVEGGVALAMVPFFIYQAILVSSWFTRLMYIEISLGLVFVAGFIYLKARYDKTEQESSSTSDFLAHYRMQLTKQADLLGKARYWYVAPIMFGVIGVAIERLVHQWSTEKLPWDAIIYLIAVILLAIGVTWLNEVHGVRELKKKIENLSSY